MKYGKFSKDGLEYIINTPHTPRDWFNIMWKKILFDAGFNPPPSYAVIATPFINLFPIKNSTLQFFPLIDWFFLLFGAFLLYRAFGIFAGLGFLIILLLYGLFWVLFLWWHLVLLLFGHLLMHFYKKM